MFFWWTVVQTCMAPVLCLKSGSPDLEIDARFALSAGTPPPA
jgi:hypothetical protein